MRILNYLLLNIFVIPASQIQRAAFRNSLLLNQWVSIL